MPIPGFLTAISPRLEELVITADDSDSSGFESESASILERMVVTDITPVPLFPRVKRLQLTGPRIDPALLANVIQFREEQISQGKEAIALLGRVEISYAVDEKMRRYYAAALSTILGSFGMETRCKLVFDPRYAHLQ